MSIQYHYNIRNEVVSTQSNTTRITILISPNTHHLEQE